MRAPMMASEAEILERAQKGEIAAFQEIVERYKKNVYYLALDLTGNHEDAEDLSQDVFIRAYQSIARFRGEAKLSSWLYRITVNTHINSKRKKSLRLISIYPQKEGEPEIQVADPSPDPHTEVESRHVQKDIDSALDQLTPRERAVFVLRHYNDLMLEDIAKTLEISEGTVKSLLFRACRRLRKEIGRASCRERV